MHNLVEGSGLIDIRNRESTRLSGNCLSAVNPGYVRRRAFYNRSFCLFPTSADSTLEYELHLLSLAGAALDRGNAHPRVAVFPIS